MKADLASEKELKELWRTWCDPESCGCDKGACVPNQCLRTFKAGARAFEKKSGIVRIIETRPGCNVYVVASDLRKGPVLVKVEEEK